VDGINVIEDWDLQASHAGKSMVDNGVTIEDLEDSEKEVAGKLGVEIRTSVEPKHLVNFSGESHVGKEIKDSQVRGQNKAKRKERKTETIEHQRSTFEGLQTVGYESQ
jgi:hypothetical protein